MSVCQLNLRAATWLAGGCWFCRAASAGDGADSMVLGGGAGLHHDAGIAGLCVWTRASSTFDKSSRGFCVAARARAQRRQSGRAGEQERSAQIRRNGWCPGRPRGHQDRSQAGARNWSPISVPRVRAWSPFIAGRGRRELRERPLGKERVSIQHLR